MSPNKKMVYIWDENLDYFEGLARNKQASTIINQLLVEKRRTIQKSDDQMAEVRVKLGYNEPTPEPTE